MQNAMSIPWICHVGKEHFQPSEGCICSKCSRPTCFSHTFVIEDGGEEFQRHVYQITSSVQLVGVVRKQSQGKLNLRFVCSKCLGGGNQ